MAVRSPAGLVEYRAQYRWAVIVFTVFFLILLGRFLFLQIVHGDEYRRKQDESRLRTTRVEARRGRILDRNGKVLAFNVETHDLVMMPSQVKNPDQSVERLRRLLWLNDEETEQLREIVKVGMETPGRYDRVTVRKDLANEYCPFDSTKLEALDAPVERLWCSQCGSDYEAVDSSAHRCPDNPRRRLVWNKDHTGAHCDKGSKEYVSGTACPHDGSPLKKRNYILRCSECSRQFNNEKAIIEPYLYEMPGFQVDTRLRRVYPHRNLVAHVTGYMAQVNRKDLDRHPERYVERDRIGRVGAERAFERELRGTWGKRYRILEPIEDGGPLVELPVPEREDEPMINGATVRLTLDLELQQMVRRAMRYQRSGAAVVMHVATGDVLAMYSVPSYDPNEWSGRLSREVYRATINNPYSPMINKAVTSYAPGSVYKVAPVVAGLDNGVVDVTTEIDCKGGYEFGGRRFRCHDRIGHGPVNYVQALSKSCDVYFYWLGEQLGMDTLHAYATKYFGFGQSTGIGIGESSGIVPNKDWHRRNERVWMPGFTLSTAVGQKDVRATPLQVARAFIPMANGGELIEARIVRQFEDVHGNVIRAMTRESTGRIPVSEEDMARMQEGLWRVVNDENGTAFNARLDGLEIAGKTGTAEAAESKPGVSDEIKRWLLDDHAWFVGYAPARNPEIVVCVFLEHGHSGSKAAAPVATRIFKSYFQQYGTGSDSYSGVKNPITDPAVPLEKDKMDDEPDINRVPIDIEE